MYPPTVVHLDYGSLHLTNDLEAQEVQYAANAGGVDILYTHTR